MESLRQPDCQVNHINSVFEYRSPTPQADPSVMMLHNGFSANSHNMCGYSSGNLVDSVRQSFSEMTDWPATAPGWNNTPENPVDPEFWPPLIDVRLVADDVLGDVGANHVQDALDERVIANDRNGTGHRPNHENQVGGYPVYAGGTAPTDSDGDGMPNCWETANGLNPNGARGGNGDQDGDRYSNLEEYLNDLVGT